MNAQLCQAGRSGASVSMHLSKPTQSRRVRRAATAKESPSQQSGASTSASPEAAAPIQPAVREFRALGCKVVETTESFKGPEDQKDFWEGEKFEAFGKVLEKYFVPGLLALGLLCGGIAAKTYNDGATAFVKPPTGPDAEPSIIIAIPEGDLPSGAPSISD